MPDVFAMIDLTVLGRLLLAGVLGGIIGIERELSGKPAGFRTNILICLGSALFSQIALFSVATYEIGDPTRVLAQIITGIGFLGAGAIIQAGESVHGLTSAATIWVVAGVGMAVGIGDYFAALSATLGAVFVLWIMRFFERTVKTQTEKIKEKVNAFRKTGDNN